MHYLLLVPLSSFRFLFTALSTTYLYIQSFRLINVTCGFLPTFDYAQAVAIDCKTETEKGRCGFYFYLGVKVISLLLTN